MNDDGGSPPQTNITTATTTTTTTSTRKRNIQKYSIAVDDDVIAYPLLYKNLYDPLSKVPIRNHHESNNDTSNDRLAPPPPPPPTPIEDNVHGLISPLLIFWMQIILLLFVFTFCVYFGFNSPEASNIKDLKKTVDAIQYALNNSIVPVDEDTVRFIVREILSQTIDPNQLNDILQKISSLQSQLDETKDKTNALHSLLDKKVDVSQLEVTQADSIGLPDLAMTHNGGKVVNVWVKKKLADPSWLSAFRRSDKSQMYTNAAQILITPSDLPGQCFPFLGDTANITVKLACKAEVTEVSMDHASPLLLFRGKEAMPRNFQVWGTIYNPDTTSYELTSLLLNEVYDKDGKSIQTWKINNNFNPNEKYWEYITLSILSNYGDAVEEDKKYTCLYRFRVHANECAKD